MFHYVSFCIGLCLVPPAPSPQQNVGSLKAGPFSVRHPASHAQVAGDGTLPQAGVQSGESNVRAVWYSRCADTSPCPPGSYGLGTPPVPFTHSWEAPLPWVTAGAWGRGAGRAPGPRPGDGAEGCKLTPGARVKVVHLRVTTGADPVPPSGLCLLRSSPLSLSSGGAGGLSLGDTVVTRVSRHAWGTCGLQRETW